MSTLRRNILQGILIIISLSLLGFRNTNESLSNEEQLKNIIGWVEISIRADAISVGGTGGSYHIWYPATATLMIAQKPNSSSFIVQGGSAYTKVASRGFIAGGEITANVDVPMIWFVNAILYPDCSLDLAFIGINFPGVSVGCAPLVGCIRDTTPGEYAGGPTIRMPADENTVYVDIVGSNNTTATYTITKEFMSAGKNCLYLPPGLP